jgi:ADP-ribosylglycohydrolase
MHTQWFTIVKNEIVQSLQEGKDPNEVEALKKEAESSKDEERALVDIHTRMRLLPVRKDFPFHEPSDLNEIRALRTQTSRATGFTGDDETLFDKLYGAWLGRCAGCALGKPVEWLESVKYGWERQKNYLTAVSPDEWPIRDYFPASSPAGRCGSPQSTRESIAFMETDDDIRYTVMGQKILLEKGRDFQSVDVVKEWLGLGYRYFFTAEKQAYRNYILRDELWTLNDTEVDSKMDWSWFSGHLNPYREWIGAQIRIDSHAYAAPGNPELAAEFAWRDARISHVKNGIYGAMFCAAMIAKAFVTDDVHTIIAAGLGEIPRTSRLYSDLRAVMEICERHEYAHDRFEEVYRAVYDLLGHYSAVHTNNNAALCVVALLLSGGDFHRGITIAVMGGWDTDCNGATVGSILGAIHGAKRLPQHWIGRLNDTLYSGIIGYDPIAISECAKRSVEVIRKIHA